MSSKAIEVITRLFGCTEEDYNNRKNWLNLYDDSRTIYLVNRGVDQSNQDESSLGSFGYTDLYYGSRRLSDVFVVKDIPNNDDYPNDKIYLVPKSSTDKWKLKDGNFVTPVGFDIYFKHDNVVTPVSTSLIKEIKYVNEKLQLTISTSEDGDVPVTILTEENLSAVLRDLPDDAAEAIALRVSGIVTSSVLNSVRSEIDSAISSTKSYVDSKISDVQGNLDNTNRRVSEVSTRVSTVQGNLDSTSHRVSDLESRLKWRIYKP